MFEKIYPRMITIDHEDISNLRSIRNDNTKEVAFLVSDECITTFEGQADSIDEIPIGNWIIGHSHPPLEEYEYNMSPLATQPLVFQLQPVLGWFGDVGSARLVLTKGDTLPPPPLVDVSPAVNFTLQLAPTSLEPTETNTSHLS